MMNDSSPQGRRESPAGAGGASPASGVDAAGGLHCIFHLGAHKTASSHLAQTLRANQEVLERFSLAHPVKEDLRNSVTRQLSSIPAKGDLPPEALQALASLRQGRRRLLVADENIIGTCARLFKDDKMYPHAVSRTRAASRLVTEGSFEIMIAIRAPASFLVSAYGEAMRTMGYLGFRDFLKGTDLRRARWMPMIRGIRRVVPEVPITVWTFESYRDNMDRIMRQILGLGAEDELPALRQQSKVVRPGLSARAVEEIKALQEQLGRVPPRESMEDIVKRFPKSDEFPAPAPFSEAERKLMAQTYRRDLSGIAGLPGVTLLPTTAT